MSEPIPCPKCGRIFVWNGTRCMNQECRFGSTEKPIRKRKQRSAVRPNKLPASFEERWESIPKLDEATINQLLSNLKSNRYGWKSAIPIEYGNFFGSPIGIDIQIREFPDGRRLPSVSDDELRLLKKVLAEFREIVRVAELQFEKYTIDSDPPAKCLIKKPHIWHTRSEEIEKKPNGWTLVVGTKESPDFGWHLEFEGTDFREIWAGD